MEKSNATKSRYTVTLRNAHMLVISAISVESSEVHECFIYVYATPAPGTSSKLLGPRYNTFSLAFNVNTIILVMKDSFENT